MEGAWNELEFKKQLEAILWFGETGDGQLCYREQLTNRLNSIISSDSGASGYKK